MVRVRIAGIALIAFAVVSSGASAAGRTVKDGVDALQQGDPARAVAIWRPLARKGDPDAAFDLGQSYRFGRGVAPDSAQAKKWFEAAARTGHLQAQVSLGLLLFDIGDRSNALIWLKRAADRGEPRALLVTGTALFNGDGMKRDPILGYAYVRRAAAQGLAPAVSTLAEMERILPLEDRKRAIALVMNSPAAKQPTVRVAPAKPIAGNLTTAPARTSSTTPLSVASGGGWRIQLGAFGNRGAAQALFARLAPSLGGAQGYYIPVGAITRLQAGPFASSAAASQACARLKPQPCFAVAAK